jgi:hypothetical protein
LGKGDFGPQDRKQDRITNLVKMIASGTPFHLAGGAGQVVIKKDKTLLALLKTITPATYSQIPNTFMTTDGRSIRLSQLEKTGEFGGTSAVDNPHSKEALPIKPSQIGISGTESKFDPESPDALKIAMQSGAFRAGELGKKIQSDSVLQGAGFTGHSVIGMSKQISMGQVPDMPKKDQLPVTALKAIRDYAGEYLGVQQMVEGIANFPNSDDFFEFLQVDQESMKNLVLYFPKSTNTPLADSLALQNSATGHVLKLSAKGAKAGAPPSMDNLKVPENIRSSKNKNIVNVVKLLDEARAASAATQPFKVMQYLINTVPSKVPDAIKAVFPITESEFNKLEATYSNPNLPCPQKFVKLANIKGMKGAPLSGTHFGRVHYQINKVILDIINKQNAFPAFRKTVLEILGYNFIQIFSRERQGKLFADVLWPGTVNGSVEIYSKSSSADPKHQKLSFSVTEG